MENNQQNEIILYQPNETVRLEVRLEDETVWLTQAQMAELFGTTKQNISLHISNIYKEEELIRKATVKESLTVQPEGLRMIRRRLVYYNLDVIISVGYRVKSVVGTRFRQWATRILKEHMLRGFTVNARLIQMEDRIDRRLAQHDAAIADLREQVDFFIRTNEQPVQGVFYDGQLWDACSFVEKLIAKAKKTILLIDSWVDQGTLDMLAKKRKSVVVEIVTSKRGNKLAASDVAKFNVQYPTLTIRESIAFHDRFLILDDKEIYLIGASLKDLGKKCFGFTRMDAGEISGIKVRV